MDDQTLLEKINRAKDAFGKKCKKYSGALTVELFKDALASHGIETSPRDVFIRGVPIEIDLLIPRPGILPENCLLYEPEDVFIILEIKNYGSFGEKTINRIKRNFEYIKEHHPYINCFFVTILERKGFRWAITENNIGFPTYTLFWYYGSGMKERFDTSNDWGRLINEIGHILKMSNKKCDI